MQAHLFLITQKQKSIDKTLDSASRSYCMSARIRLANTVSKVLLSTFLRVWNQHPGIASLTSFSMSLRICWYGAQCGGLLHLADPHLDVLLSGEQFDQL